nr:MAG TPA: hypothetical protein [Caudoviricetes sp.]
MYPLLIILFYCVCILLLYYGLKSRLSSTFCKFL